MTPNAAVEQIFLPTAPRAPDGGKAAGQTDAGDDSPTSFAEQMSLARQTGRADSETMSDQPDQNSQPPAEQTPPEMMTTVDTDQADLPETDPANLMAVWDVPSPETTSDIPEDQIYREAAQLAIIETDVEPGDNIVEQQNVAVPQPKGAAAHDVAVVKPEASEVEAGPEKTTSNTQASRQTGIAETGVKNTEPNIENIDVSKQESTAPHRAAAQAATPVAQEATRPIQQPPVETATDTSVEPLPAAPFDNASSQSGSQDRPPPQTPRSPIDLISPEAGVGSRETVTSTGQTDGASSAQPVRTPLFNQVVRQVQFSLQQGQGETIIKLRPEHLGMMQVQVVVENRMVKTRIVVEHEDTRRLIESSMPNLRQSLADQGLRVDQLDVESDRNAFESFQQRHEQTQRNPQLNRLAQSIPVEEEHMQDAGQDTSVTGTHQVDMLV